MRRKRELTSPDKPARDEFNTNTDSGSDAFSALPEEILHIILASLFSRDLRNLRLIFLAFRRPPIFRLRKYLLEEMPWLWGLETVSPGSLHWYHLFNKTKFLWTDVNKGLRNRKRI